jgi:carbamoyl-phosphate synthase large subunit
LFTSLSGKISLYEGVLAQARKFHPDAQLIGGDCDAACPSRSQVEQFTETPPLDQTTGEEFAAFCQELGVTHLIPTRDGELPFFAENRSSLLAAGVQSMISSPQTIATCLDKALFAETAANLGFPAIPTMDDLSKLDAARVTVKERRGAGSRDLHLDLPPEEAEERAQGLREPIFQPHLRGRELSADLYLDQSGQSRGVVLRWRDLVVDGESKVTTTFRKAEWESELGELAAQVGLEGHGLVQAIVDEEYRLNLLEINARLGGASPLALACGLNSIEWFLMESRGESLGELSPFDYPAGKRLTRDDAGRDALSKI